MEVVFSHLLRGDIGSVDHRPLIVGALCHHFPNLVPAWLVPPFSHTPSFARYIRALYGTCVHLQFCD